MGLFTRKQDAIAIKEEYQKALDYAHEKVKEQIGVLYNMNHKLKWALSEIQKYKKDIIVDEEEKNELYATLNNLLIKETSFEKEMLEMSQKGKGNAKVLIKPKIKDSEVDNFRINAVHEFLEKYPKYASEPRFKSTWDKIVEIEREIKKTKKEYNRAITDALREIAYFPRNFANAEDKIKRFKDQLKEAEMKLRENGFEKTLRYKFSSFKEKQKCAIHTLYYRIEEYEHVVKDLSQEVAKAKRQDLEEMEY